MGPGELLRNRRFILTIIVLIAVCAAGFAFLARTPLLLRSIAIISAPLLGYDLDAESSSFHPFRRVDLKNFTFADTRGKNFLFTASRLTVDTTPKGVFKGDVEKVLLKDAKIRIRLGDKKETETDLSFIRKIPSVRLLTMQNGEFTLLFKRSDTQVHLKRIELTVKDFSPEHGGMLSFTGLVSINGPGSPELSAAGKCKGTLQLTGIFPDMLGKGTVELDIEAFTAGKLSTKGTKITLPVQFDKGQINIVRSNIAIEEFLLMQDGAEGRAEKIFDHDKCTVPDQNRNYLFRQYRDNHARRGVIKWHSAPQPERGDAHKRIIGNERAQFFESFFTGKIPDDAGRGQKMVHRGAGLPQRPYGGKPFRRNAVPFRNHHDGYKEGRFRIA